MGQTSPLRIFGLATGLLLYLSACQSSPPPPTIAPTLSLEEIQSLVVATMAAESAASAPEPTDTAPPPPSDTPVPTPSETPTPAATPTVTLPVASEVDCIPKGTLRQVARVLSVTDGDTIRVEIEGQSVPIRYIGIDTPEVGQPLFSEATSRNSSFVQGQTVTLVKDVSEIDIYDRLLRYVISSNRFVNYELVRQGYAMVSTYPPDVACSPTFAEAQNVAASSGLGLWAIPPTAMPTQPTAPTEAGNCHPSYVGVCLKMGIGDYDCSSGSGNGPNYAYGPFQVVGYDEFGLDGDGDGIGCEGG